MSRVLSDNELFKTGGHGGYFNHNPMAWGLTICEESKELIVRCLKKFA
jgi:hypothetical protein